MDLGLGQVDLTPQEEEARREERIARGRRRAAAISTANANLYALVEERYSTLWKVHENETQALEILCNYESAYQILQIKLEGKSEKEKEAYWSTSEALEIKEGHAKYQRVCHLTRKIWEMKVAMCSSDLFHSVYRVLCLRVFEMEFPLSLDKQELEQSILRAINRHLDTFFKSYKYYGRTCMFMDRIHMLSPDEFEKLRTHVMKKLSDLKLFKLDESGKYAKEVVYELWELFGDLKRLFNEQKTCKTSPLYLDECVKELAGRKFGVHWCFIDKLKSEGYLLVRRDSSRTVHTKRGWNYDKFHQETLHWQVYNFNSMYNEQFPNHAECEYETIPFLNLFMRKNIERMLPGLVDAMKELNVFTTPPSKKEGGFIPGDRYENPWVRSGPAYQFHKSPEGEFYNLWKTWPSDHACRNHQNFPGTTNDIIRPDSMEAKDPLNDALRVHLRGCPDQEAWLARLENLY